MPDGYLNIALVFFPYVAFPQFQQSELVHCVAPNDGQEEEEVIISKIKATKLKC